VEFAPSKKGDACDRCGERLVQRSDDKPEAIETRLRVYEEQTAPLIRYYSSKRLLSELDASGSVDAVFEALFGVLAPYSAI
jgi:adenylate kinase